MFQGLIHGSEVAHGPRHCGKFSCIGPELLHVDLKFITMAMITQRVEEPAVLFTRDNDALKRQLAKFSAHWPNMTPEWFESRAWIWLHYAVVKLGRGELFEALG